MKKTKLICRNNEDKFEEALNEFIKDKGDCVIQYKPVSAAGQVCFVWYTALVIWEEETDCDSATNKKDWGHP